MISSFTAALLSVMASNEMYTVISCFGVAPFMCTVLFYANVVNVSIYN